MVVLGLARPVGDVRVSGPVARRSVHLPVRPTGPGGPQPRRSSSRPGRHFRPVRPKPHSGDPSPACPGPRRMSPSPADRQNTPHAAPGRSAAPAPSARSGRRPAAGRTPSGADGRGGCASPAARSAPTVDVARRRCQGVHLVNWLVGVVNAVPYSPGTGGVQGAYPRTRRRSAPRALPVCSPAGFGRNRSRDPAGCPWWRKPAAGVALGVPRRRAASESGVPVFLVVLVRP